MAYELPDLPYAKDALAPHLSAETLEYHHDKHHAAYVAKVNELLDGDSSKSLDELVRTAEGVLFDQAAQAWNHEFYWKCMKPNGGGAPSGDLASAIDASFGSFDAFADQFAKVSTGVFGSGWGWLVKDGGGLAVVGTSNAGNPMTEGKTPLLTCDVWEHAYYIDYRNLRPKYVQVFLEHLVDWDFVAERFASA